MTGAEIATALHFVARGLTDGFFPDLPSLWQSWQMQVSQCRILAIFCDAYCAAGETNLVVQNFSNEMLANLFELAKSNPAENAPLKVCITVLSDHISESVSRSDAWLPVRNLEITPVGCCVEC